MRILIDIGHPAHVHYFRHFIQQMKVKGHCFMVVARDRQYVFELLKAYGIDFVSRGKGGRSWLGKSIYLIRTSFRQVLLARKFRPDLFLDFGTMYSGWASMVLRKPHLVFTDTENTRIYRFFYTPFASVVFTPHCYESDLGKKHRRFHGYMELCYLHDNYYKPDLQVLKTLGIQPGERYSIMRFVGWEALHDTGQSGLPVAVKRKLVKLLLGYGKVFISSEKELPDDLKAFELKLPVEKIHDALYYASLFVGESATMASESVVLGTPAIYFDNVGRGYTRDQERSYQALCHFPLNQESMSAVRKQVERLLNGKNGWSLRSKIQADCVDVTQFLMDYVESSFPCRIC
jgi:predicted glycosyltransferase